MAEFEKLRGEADGSGGRADNRVSNVPAGIELSGAQICGNQVYPIGAIGEPAGRETRRVQSLRRVRNPDLPRLRAPLTIRRGVGVDNKVSKMLAAIGVLLRCSYFCAIFSP